MTYGNACLATAVVALTVIVGAGPVLNASPAQAAGDCTPVAIIAFRGSEEVNLDTSAQTLAGTAHRYGSSALVTNGWEGPILSRLFTKFVSAARNSTWPAGFDPANVPVLSIGYDGETGYPAIPPAAKPSIFGDLVVSSNKGAAYAGTVMSGYANSQPAGCNTKFIGVGYSQGAMAARVLAQAAPTRVLGVIDFGDPYQKPNASGNQGTAINGEGIIRWWQGSADRAVSDSFYGLAAQKTALCHAKDPICSYSWLFGLGALVTAMDTHMNYFEVGTEANTKAVELANLAAKLTAIYTPVAARGGFAVSIPPTASLRAGGLMLTGIPVVLSSLDSSADGPAIYDFDLDGDGSLETANAPAVLDQEFAAGTHTVGLRITDNSGRTSTTSMTFVVIDQDAVVNAAPDPADASTALSHVTLSSDITSAGSPVILTVADELGLGELVGARLVRVGDDSVWTAPAIAVFGPAAKSPLGASLSVDVPSSVQAGEYTLLVFSDQGRHSTLPLTVTDPLA
jgi:hypothetical protein